MNFTSYFKDLAAMASAQSAHDNACPPEEHDRECPECGAEIQTHQEGWRCMNHNCSWSAYPDFSEPANRRLR